MKNAVPLFLLCLWGCNSPNKALIGEWSGEEPGSKLVVTETEMIFKTKKGTETKQYKMVSSDEIAFAGATCKIEVTPTSLTLRLRDGIKTFTKQPDRD